MPFDQGTIALTIFKLPESLPENYLEAFNANSAGKVDDTKDEPMYGWTSARYLLETKICEENSLPGGFPHMSLRTSQRKIPTTLLNAICRRDEIAYMNANETDYVPNREKKDIKENVIEQNLMKMPPSISGFPFVIDTTTDYLYLGATSAPQTDIFIALFVKTVGIEPKPVNPASIMIEEYQQDINNLQKINFIEGNNNDSEIGWDFLTWLWYFCEDGGKVDLDNLGEFSAFVDGPLTFILDGDEQGAVETVIKKGNPTNSAEAKASLQAGKKLKKAKLTITRGEDIWSCSFDAQTFTFSGLKLPDGEKMHREEKFIERMENLHIFHQAIRGYFKQFAETLKAKDWNSVEKRIQNWVSEKKAF